MQPAYAAPAFEPTVCRRTTRLVGAFRAVADLARSGEAEAEPRVGDDSWNARRSVDGHRYGSGPQGGDAPLGARVVPPRWQRSPECQHHARHGESRCDTWPAARHDGGNSQDARRSHQSRDDNGDDTSSHQSEVLNDGHADDACDRKDSRRDSTDPRRAHGRDPRTRWPIRDPRSPPRQRRLPSRGARPPARSGIAIRDGRLPALPPQLEVCRPGGRSWIRARRVRLGPAVDR